MNLRKFSPFLLTALCMEAVTSDACATSSPAPGKKEVVSEKVTFADGRVVEFVGKKRMLKESIIERNEGGTVTALSVRFDFKHGKSLTFDVLASGLVYELAAHGAAQKLGDAAAGTTDVEEMYLEVEDVLERLSKGQFNAERGEGFSGVPVLARAVHEYQTSQGKTKTLDEVTAWLKAKSKDERTAIKVNPKIKAILDRLEAEKVKGTVDAEALLDAI